MLKKDHIFLCASNSLGRATSRSLRSQGSFSGSSLFPKALPPVTDPPSHLSLLHLDVSPVLWEWSKALQPLQGLLSLSPANSYKVPWPGLGTFVSFKAIFTDTDMSMRWNILSKPTTSGCLCSITWSVWMLKFRGLWPGRSDELSPKHSHTIIVYHLYFLTLLLLWFTSFGGISNNSPPTSEHLMVKSVWFTIRYRGFNTTILVMPKLLSWIWTPTYERDGKLKHYDYHFQEVHSSILEFS